MFLTDSEIFDRYLNADNPSGEIMRLAQVCGAKPSQIIKVLQSGGMELPEGMEQPAVCASTPIPEQSSKKPGPSARVWTNELVEWMLRLKREQKSTQEIAEALGMEPKRVQNKLSRMRTLGKDRTEAPYPMPPAQTKPLSADAAAPKAALQDMVDGMLRLIEFARTYFQTEGIIAGQADNDNRFAWVLFEAERLRCHLRLEVERIPNEEAPAKYKTPGSIEAQSGADENSPLL